MAEHQAAIGRGVGKLDTDCNGLAKYSLRLEFPAGIGEGNEPELSLEYSQGSPNGVLGIGWALSGLSSIWTCPANLAWDGANTPPSDYDPSASKFALDGAQLLNVEGAYEKPDSKYALEIDQLGRTIVPYDSGFRSFDKFGFTSEYGTTADSRLLLSDNKTVREWKLKKKTDMCGNNVIYNYTVSPKGNGECQDFNTSYLSSICYTGNDITGIPGSRMVEFEYSAREDIVVQCRQGMIIRWCHLLSAIHFEVVVNGSRTVHRSIELSYVRSTATGDSQLVSITQVSTLTQKKISLLPHSFRYTILETPQEDLFRRFPQTAFPLQHTTNNVALFSLNISGRSLADIGIVRFDQNTQRMSLKTYLAIRQHDGTCTWEQSKGPGSEAELPVIEHSKSFPSILSPDINLDGRSDIVIPHRDSAGYLRFSLSQSNGSGFLPYTLKTTPYRWIDDARFIAVDIAGRGAVDVVQIYTADQNRLGFRCFAAINREGKLGLSDATTSETKYENTNTVDWIQLRHATTGANSLVRVWLKDIGLGKRQIVATSFTIENGLDSRRKVREETTSLLGEPIKKDDPVYSVLPCDINGDGTQDIVLASRIYRFNKLQLKFEVFVNDGSGNFSRHGNTILREVNVPPPVNLTQYGSFYLSNLNGSNYPSLCFVYQERDSKTHLCVSVAGLSDGTLSHATVSHLAKNLPTDKMQLLPQDINGNGLGDWLFYTLDNDRPRIVPIYNGGKVVDLMSWAEDPMGLRTTIEYGCMTDPLVYTPGLPKDNSDNTDGSYLLGAAPNLVVTSLTSTNNSAINTLPYKVEIAKSYASARVSMKGRGWLGFESIETLNKTDSILTAEEYHQNWPLTGLKSFVRTMTAERRVMMQEMAGYRTFHEPKGPWKVYRVDTVSESTETLALSDGDGSRRITTEYEYDVSGNVTLQHRAEKQKDEVVHQSWQRSTYTQINYNTGLLTGTKISAESGNNNMMLFEKGDTSLIQVKYDPRTAKIIANGTWSSDVGAFVQQTYSYDDYGKETKSLDAAGLEVTTTYDQVFHSYPVISTARGQGVLAAKMMAYDLFSGHEICHREETGLITCHRRDAFERVVETRQNARPGQKHPGLVQATNFLGENVVMHDELAKILASTTLDPGREVAFSRCTSSTDRKYLTITTLDTTSPKSHSRSELLEVMDCAQNVRKRAVRNGIEPSRTWTASTYDSRGLRLSASLPTKLDANNDTPELDWEPDLDLRLTLNSEYDVLGRLMLELRPAHGHQNYRVALSKMYRDGGGMVRETVSRTDVPDKILSTRETCYVDIGDGVILSRTDENGLMTKFEYDVEGRLLLCTDPAGQIERRMYTSRGELAALDNVYQNPRRRPGEWAMEWGFDAAGYLIRTTNAAGEVIMFERDAGGRTIRQIGQSGHVIEYGYDVGGCEQLLETRIYADVKTRAIESCWRYTYDHRGRLSSQTVAFGDSREEYTLKFEYDWADRLVRKVFPDGSDAVYMYSGNDVRSGKISSGSAAAVMTPWELEAEVERRNASGNAELISLAGSGLEGGAVHTRSYDSLGFPLVRSFQKGASVCVEDQYMYNDLDQISRKDEIVIGDFMDYTYSGRRLTSVKKKDGSAQHFTYDDSGNLRQKGNMTLTTQGHDLVGMRDEKVTLRSTYDDCGRLSERHADQSTSKLTYNDFGNLKSWIDKSSGAVTQNICNDFGHSILQRYPDGSCKIKLDQDFIIETSPSRESVAHHFLRIEEDLLGKVSSVYNHSSESDAPESTLGDSKTTTSLMFTDTKGSVTHIFRSDLHSKLEYDAYGTLINSPLIPPSDLHTTYESKHSAQDIGLLDFGGRYYDPLFGRFTTPDPLSSPALLQQPCGPNKYCFESNDPINNIDPDGYWSLSSILGVVIGSVLVAASVALAIVTGGAATPLAAAAVGALAAGGIAGIMYSVERKDEPDPAKFWAGYYATVQVNALIGAATGAFGAVATPARFASGTGRLASGMARAAAARGVPASARLMSIGAKAGIGGLAAVVGKAAGRSVTNAVYGEERDLFEGAGKTFAGGAAVGAVMGAWGARSSKTAAEGGGEVVGAGGSGGLKGHGFKRIAKAAVKAVLKPGFKLGWKFAEKDLLH